MDARTSSERADADAAPSHARHDITRRPDECTMVIVPLPARSAVDVRGADAREFLQSKLTVDVRKWSDTGGAYGFALDINGRIVFDAVIVPIDDNTIRLWSEPGCCDTLVNWLRRYVITEDVTVTPVETTAYWLVGADSAHDIDSALGVVFSAPFGYQKLDEAAVIATARSARPARILEGSSDKLRSLLQQHGAVPVPWESWRAWEIREGFVRVGVDLIRGKTMPLEVHETFGVDYNKGCYLGQEVVERLRSRGTPNRSYRRIRWLGEPVATPQLITDDTGKTSGRVTSCATQGEASVGIAMIRRRALQESLPLYLKSPQGPAIQIIGDVR